MFVGNNKVYRYLSIETGVEGRVSGIIWGWWAVVITTTKPRECSKDTAVPTQRAGSQSVLFGDYGQDRVESKADTI